MLHSRLHSPLHGVTQREWRRVLIFAVAVMMLTTLPYLVALTSQRAGWQFGGFMFGADDGNSYLAKMREGAQGNWLFHIVYTSERHDGAFLFTPYLVLGKIATIFASPESPALVVSMLLVFHAARILFGILAIAVTYRFVALFVPRGSMRWTAITLICLGGGLGWLLILMGQDNWLGSAPVDFYLPEGYTFYLLYGLPHLSLARAALLGGLIYFFRTNLQPPNSAQKPGSELNLLFAGLCWLVMGLCVPFYVAVLYAILGLWGITVFIRQRCFPTRLFFRGIAVTLIPAPLLIYQVIVFATNPIMGAWSQQNKLPSPHPAHYLLGYGVLAVLAIPGLGWAWRHGKQHPAYLLLPVWVIAAPLLAYLPVTVQRRLLEGMFVPLCILAVIGLRFVIAPRLRARRRPARWVWQRAIAVVLILTLPTTVLLLLSGVLAATHPGSPLFHPGGEVAALDWLNTHAAPDSVVLSSAPIGNYLPARANLRTYVGHGPETINFDEKRTLSARFFGGERTLIQLQNSSQDPIRYVFYGPQEMKGQTPQSAVRWSAGLKQIYAQGDYTIYEVP